MGSPDADVEEAAPMAEGDLALVVDDVAPDAVMVVERAELGELRLTVKQNHAFYITSLPDRAAASWPPPPSRSARATR